MKYIQNKNKNHKIITAECLYSSSHVILQNVVKKLQITETWIKYPSC